MPSLRALAILLSLLLLPVLASTAAAEDLVRPSASRSAPVELRPVAAPVPLDGPTLRRAIRARMPEVRACYERALKQGSELQGRMVVAWTIAVDGSVSEVAVAADDLGEPRLNRCVTDTIGGWRFPEGTGETEVEYPLQFGSTAVAYAVATP